MTPEELLHAHLPIADRVAAEFAVRTPVRRDDLYAEALVGLWLAATIWRPAGPTSDFRPFAVQRVRWRVIGLIRDELGRRATTRVRRRRFRDAVRIDHDHQERDVRAVDPAAHAVSVLEAERLRGVALDGLRNGKRAAVEMWLDGHKETEIRLSTGVKPGTLSNLRMAVRERVEEALEA